MRRSYKLINTRGSTSKRFSSLSEAFKFLKPDSEDLQIRDLANRNCGRPLRFADGYSFVRSDLAK